MNKIAFIIQARLGSTRLPKKIILPFHEGRSIIEIMINKLQDNFQYPIILATTKNAMDDKLVEMCVQHEILSYRGEENDVLKRFVSAAENFGIKAVVRICSDNPFLSVNYIAELLEFWDDKFDYVSYCLSDGIPSILTHYGFWAEIVKIDALLKTDKLLGESDEDREHVTSFIKS